MPGQIRTAHRHPDAEAPPRQSAHRMPAQKAGTTDKRNEPSGIVSLGHGFACLFVLETEPEVAFLAVPLLLAKPYSHRSLPRAACFG
jgi:hypothetical protein